jgi:ubiquinone/menaquinone biosynthesis C-methylase UbiE
MTENAKARDFFRSGGRDYDRAHYQASTRSFISDRNALLLEVLSQLPLSNGASLLEVGCGPGYFLAGAWRHCPYVVGVDTSAEMLELSRTRLPDSALQVLRLVGGSITALPFPDSHFQVVVSAGVLEYIQNGTIPLREIHRVLSPGGFALLPITNKLSPALVTARLLDRLKRWPLIMEPFNRAWTRKGRPPVRARHFPVRLDTPFSHRKALRSAGFTVVAEHFFHLAPLPRPAEQLAPKLTTRLLNATDALLHTPLRLLAEGHLAVCTKTRGPDTPLDAPPADPS